MLLGQLCGRLKKANGNPFAKDMRLTQFAEGCQCLGEMTERVANSLLLLAEGF
jgi:hypothetical protein